MNIIEEREYWCWSQKRYCPYVGVMSGKCMAGKFMFDECKPNSYDTNTIDTNEKLPKEYLLDKHKYNEDYYKYYEIIINIKRG